MLELKMEAFAYQDIKKNLLFCFKTCSNLVVGCVYLNNQC